MSWDCYQLVYRLQSPLRVGLREVGNLQETRHYVPGKVLWGALTARLTRNQGMGLHFDAYMQVGETLRQNMRFGYLWPSLDAQTPFYHWQDPARFDYHFLNSYVSTALDYDGQSAEAGSLHEAEYIAPHTRQGDPVYLTGQLWVRPEIPQDSWQTALRQLVLGGERRYGWGRVSLRGDLTPLPPDQAPNPDDFSWDQPIPAHLLAHPRPSGAIQGNLEPLIGWEARPQGGKGLSARAAIVYAPGAKLGNGVARFRISDQYGIWEALA